MEAMDVEGYIGVRLSDSSSEPVGVVAMLSKHGFENSQAAKSVLDAFVPRAAAELERKRSDDTRRENEERHQAFISSNPDAMWRIEFDQPIPLSLTEEQQIDRIVRTGYLAECNEAFTRLAGFESQEGLLGLRLGEIAGRIHPEYREELRAAIRSGFRATVETALTLGGSRQVYRLRSHFGIVEDGALRRIWGLTRDITDLRLAELSLAVSERRFREVLEGIELPAVMLDPGGEVTFVNESFLALVQRPREEILTLTWLNGVVPGDEFDRWKAALRPDKHGRHSPVRFEGTIIPREGPARVIAWDTIALRDQDNRVAGLAMIGQDLTRQRALETEIRLAQKLDSIGRLAAGLAHDFNNLLTVILGNVGELLQQTSKADPAHERISTIENAAMRSARLIGQLLAFGRKQHLKPQRIRLNEVITGSEQIIRSLIGSGIELIIELTSPLGLVYADPTQIQRVLTNLAGNASDAMPQGGKLTVATSHLTIRTDDPAYPGARAGDYVLLSVSDTGVGLAEEARAHIFEPFFTTKPGKGSGLGLATVYGIVTQSGGHIGVHSEPGEGTRLDILLPREHEQ